MSHIDFSNVEKTPSNITILWPIKRSEGFENVTLTGNIEGKAARKIPNELVLMIYRKKRLREITKRQNMLKVTKRRKLGRAMIAHVLGVHDT